MANKSYVLDIVLNAKDNASAPIGNVLGSLGKFAVAGAGIAAAGVAIGKTAGSLWDATMASADLEAQMSGVAAVLQVTADEAAPLKDLILDLGIDPALKVNATEAADAIEMLARNGLSMSEILDGAARNTVLLANATSADFGTAADIATDVMALFNIEAKDMAIAVDGITSVVNNSKFSIDDYALALAQGGGVAATVGVEFDDFNAAIAAMSPLFASGSDAGTSFKVMLQSLVPNSKEASEAIAALGLEFFNADGSMKSMAEIAGQLNAVFSGNEFTVLETVGGVTRDMAKAAERAADKMPDLTTQIAEQQAQLAILQRELSETASKYGEGSTQADRKRLAITKLTNDIAAGQAQLAEYQGAIGAVSNAQTRTVEVTKSLTEEQKNHYLSTIFGTDAMRAAAGMAEYTAEEFLALQAAMGETDAGAAAATRMDNLAGSMEILSGITDTLKLRIGDALNPTVRAFADEAAQFLDRDGERLVGWFEGLADSTLPHVIPAIEGLSDVFSSETTFWADILGDNAATLETILAKAERFWDQHGGAVLDVIDNLKTTGQMLFDQLIGNVLDVVDIGLSLLTGDWEGAGQALERIWQRTLDTIGSIAQLGLDNVLTIVDSFMPGFKDAGAAVINGLLTGLEDGWRSVMDWFSNLRWPSLPSIPIPGFGGGQQATPGFAAGTPYAPGGWALVGERGPELVKLPRGAAVETATSTREILREILAGTADSDSRQSTVERLLSESAIQSVERERLIDNSSQSSVERLIETMAIPSMTQPPAPLPMMMAAPQTARPSRSEAGGDIYQITIHVTGNSNPEATARAVEDRFRRHARLTGA